MKYGIREQVSVPYCSMWKVATLLSGHTEVSSWKNNGTGRREVPLKKQLQFHPRTAIMKYRIMYLNIQYNCATNRPPDSADL